MVNKERIEMIIEILNNEGFVNKNGFKKKYRNHYEYIRNYKGVSWLDGKINITGDYKTIHTDKLVYVYIFNDNSAYVGITNNIKRRHLEHIRTTYISTISTHINNNPDIKYELKELTGCEYSGDVIKEKEQYYYDYYKNLGYNMLNQTGTGSLGRELVKIHKEDVCNYIIDNNITTKKELKIMNKSYFNWIQKNKLSGEFGLIDARIKNNSEIIIKYIIDNNITTIGELIKHNNKYYLWCNRNDKNILNKYLTRLR